MPAKRKMPSDSTLEKWIAEGLDHKAIQRRIEEQDGIEVALSTISGHLSRIGLTNRVRYDDFIPWGRISVDHNHAYQLTMLRTGARLAKGLPVRPLDQQRFEAWAAQLKENHVVVHYELDSPDGFYYVPARAGIDTGLIRVPD